MTAYSSVETAVDALRIGACDYLVKPLDFGSSQGNAEPEHRAFAAQREETASSQAPAESRKKNGHGDPGQEPGCVQIPCSRFIETLEPHGKRQSWLLENPARARRAGGESPAQASSRAAKPLF